MRRFRIVFVVIALLVVVPVGLLLHRAIASVELEGRTRHQSVAERIFDEMERSLSEMLVAEEERPFGQYSHESIPTGQEGGVPVRSPLADAPRLPWIVGYFQIDPDGTLHTPLRSSRDIASELSPTMNAIVSQLDLLVAPHFRGGASVGLVRSRTAPASQAPGTTVAASDTAASDTAASDTAAIDTAAGAKAASDKDDSQFAKEKQHASGAMPAFDAFRALNKGAEQRARRQAKTELAYAPDAREEAMWHDERDTPGKRADAAAPAVSAPARLEIAPMAGRVIDPQHMVLYRTVVREAQTYRQGLLLDLDGLAAWLRVAALGGNGLAGYATVTFTNPRAPAPSIEGASGFVYRHRFAEPFADLSARLALNPLPGLGSARYVYALCAAVVVAGSLGLLALYRMVSVSMAYAERRSNFVAAVSHELKTPLTAIRMYGEMLRDGIVPAEAKRAEYYRHITAESERLSRLINNVLEFSRLEKGTRQMSLLTAPLGPVVADAAPLLRAHAERAGLAFDVEVDPSLPAVRFERDAVLQILFNLVDNAVKYAGGGQFKRLSLTCRSVDTGVQVTVRDNGPGVEPRHLRKLFEPFYRGESELTRRSTGSGLGLALVHSLATQMGARATARNVPDGGFEVAVAFPAVRA